MHVTIHVQIMYNNRYVLMFFAPFFEVSGIENHEVKMNVLL